jgi:hypothetical protein
VIRRSLCFSLCLLSSFICAHDEHFSAYGVSAPSEVLNPGYGIEAATTVGNRTVIGLGMDWREPNALGERDWFLRTDARLLYGSELKTHWYPSVSLLWSPQQSLWQGWLGVGFQRELIQELGLFAHANWQPAQQEFQVMAGVRFWFTRLGSLDARVKHAEPKGAVYQSGQSTSKKLSLSSPTNAPEPEPLPVVEVPTEVSSIQPLESEAKSESPAIAPKIEDIPKLSSGWFVHLGIFRQLESIQSLEQDARLDPYRSLLTTWYDDEKAAFRLLIGPLSKPSSAEIKQSLDTQNLDSFLYQIQ